MASGDTLLVVDAWAGIAPTSDGATFAMRNQHPVATFDDTTDESLVFELVMPRNYAGTTGVTVYLHYAMTSGTSPKTIDWDVAFELIGDGVQDIDSDGFYTAKSVNGTTVPATSGHVDVVSIAFTDGTEMDSVSAGDAFRLKVTRDAAGDSSGNAELLIVEIKETET